MCPYFENSSSPSRAIEVPDNSNESRIKQPYFKLFSHSKFVKWVMTLNTYGIIVSTQYAYVRIYPIDECNAWLC